mgnify:FL=1
MKQIFFLFLSTLLFLNTPLFAEEKQENYIFDVLLNDKSIGTHTFEVIRKNEITNVTTNATFDFKILFLSVYSYQHSNTETWRNNCLHRLDASTNDNGKQYSVTASHAEDSILVTSNSEKSELSGCIRSYAYWNPALLDNQKLLNPQTGEILPAKLNELGTENVSVGDRDIEASRYRLETDKDSIDLWYDKDDNWIALQSIVREGKVLRYERKFPDNES